MSFISSSIFAAQGRPLPTKSHSNMLAAGRRSAGRLAASVAILVLSSCATDNSPYHWETSDEALGEYRVFVEEARKATGTSMDGIAKDIVEWQTLEDSVVAFVSRDTTMAGKPHWFPMDIIRDMHNSVRDEILNRARAQPRTLGDVYTLKHSTSRSARDPKVAAAAREASAFFQSLDSVNVYNTDCEAIVRQYRTYLYNVQRRGVGDRRQWLSLMREEDRLFRSFVPHLHEMGGTSASDITKATESVYKEFLHSPASDSISRYDLLVYMTMRANRRLLANATGCVADIKANKVRSADQLRAYMWMIVQPFIAIDDLGMALLSGRQEKEFEALAKEAPSALRSIASRLRLAKDETPDMPDIIIKIFISSL